LSWNILLGLLLWWHRELFFGCPTVGANIGGIRKFGRAPRTRKRESTVNTFKLSHEAEGG
jgi:hypothetical protein